MVTLSSYTLLARSANTYRWSGFCLCCMWEWRACECVRRGSWEVSIWSGLSSPPFCLWGLVPVAILGQPALQLHLGMGSWQGNGEETEVKPSILYRGWERRKENTACNHFQNTYIHTYICAHIHTYIHTYIDTCIYTCTKEVVTLKSSVTSWGLLYMLHTSHLQYFWVLIHKTVCSRSLGCFSPLQRMVRRVREMGGDTGTNRISCLQWKRGSIWTPSMRLGTGNTSQGGRGRVEWGGGKYEGGNKRVRRKGRRDKDRESERAEKRKKSMPQPGLVPRPHPAHILLPV